MPTGTRAAAPASRLLLAVSAALLAALVLADVLTGKGITLTGYFGLAALVAAAICPPVETGGLGAASVVAAVASGTWDHRFGTGQHLVACGLVLCQGLIAVFVSVTRRKRETELRQVRAVADVAQHALLPSVPAQLGGIGFAARYLSAAHEALIGGDLYEVVVTPHAVRVIVGDVRGKGLPAVRLTAIVLGAFREAAVTWLDLEQVGAACTRAVSRAADPEDFVTALLVDMHADGSLTFVSAGHHPPLILRGGDIHPVAIDEPGPPLGLAERFPAVGGAWLPADRLLMFTDGLVEARNAAGVFFPLTENLRQLQPGDIDSTLDQLTGRLNTFVGGRLRDDLALLLAERLPVGVNAHGGPELTLSQSGGVPRQR